MSPGVTISAVALRVDELLVNTENMATVKALVEECLTNPDLGNVDALRIPHDPNAPGDFTQDSLDRELGLVEDGALASCQIAVIMAALHHVHCPGVAHVFAVPEELPADREATSAEWRSMCAYVAIRDEIRNLGDYAVHWFTLQLRRF